MAFEYKQVSISWANRHEVVEAMLNVYGAHGWEAIDFRWQQGAHDFVAVTFKRETKVSGFSRPAPVVATSTLPGGTSYIGDTTPVDTSEA